MKRKSTRDKVMSVNKRSESVPEIEAYPEIRPAKTIKLVKSDYEPDAAPSEERTSANSSKAKVKREKRRQPERARKSSSPVFKSKIFWGCASVLAAFLLAFVVMPILESQNGQMVSAVVAVQDIPEGMKIESGMLQLKKVCKIDLPANAIRSEDKAIGKYTEVKLTAGDMLTSTKVGDTYYEDTYLYNLPDGKMAMSIELANLAQSVSGKIRSGDIVRIYAVNKDSNTKAANPADYAASLIDELQYVEVLAVTNSNVQDIQGKENADSAKDDTKDSKSIATVTLLVNHQQAVVLSGLSENATLYAALVVRGDDVKKQAALDTEDRYLQSMKSTDSKESREVTQ